MFSVVVQDHFTNWGQWQLQTEKNENDMDEQKLLLLVVKKTWWTNTVCVYVFSGERRCNVRPSDSVERSAEGERTAAQRRKNT